MKKIYLIGKNVIGRYALVDNDIYEKWGDKNWSVDAYGYPRHFLPIVRVNGIKQRKQILLHRLVIQATSGEIVDHINKDTLDNRRTNLRKVTKQINGVNRYKRIDNSSGHMGVTWNKSNKKWLAQLRKDGKFVLHQLFDSKQDAIESIEKKHIEIWGENSPYWYLFNLGRQSAVEELRKHIDDIETDRPFKTFDQMEGFGLACREIEQFLDLTKEKP